MKHLNSIYWVGILIVSSLPLQAQSSYQLNWKTDGSLLAIGGVSSGLGMYYRSTMTEFGTYDLENLEIGEINSFDRLATDYYSPKADKTSDYFWTGSHLLPLLFLANKKSRNDFAIVAAMYSEVFLINSGMTILTKSTFRRTRPYVYHPTASIDKKLTKTARSAFVSGHTSMTAANCFFAATIFSAYYPNSKWKPAIWTTAAIVPAITGYLRIRAGKHYPTDTIAGYALGAAIGILVPYLHKTKMENISFSGGLNGVMVQVRF